MTATNRWSTTGKIRKNHLIRVKLTLTRKATNSGATAAVGDFYQFDCKQKALPSAADAPTWTEVTDNPDQPTGFAYAGKPEQLEPIELVTVSPIPLVYDDLEEHRKSGDVFSIEYVYDDPLEDSIFTVSVANCQIINVKTEGGENNAQSQTTITLLPEGGLASNMPACATSARSGGGTL